MPENYSEYAKEILENALIVSNELGHGYIGSEHVLLGMLMCGGCAAAILLSARGADYRTVRALIERGTPVTAPMEAKPEDITPRLKGAMKTAMACADRYASKSVGSEHLLYGILEENGGAASRVLGYAGVPLGELKEDLKIYMSSTSALLGSGAREEGRARSFEYLNKYGKDLCVAAANGAIDPIIGREEEIGRLIRILCRRGKNNPCLVGDPGVGKTAAVEGIAQKVAAGEVPKELLNVHIYSLDLSSMIAGAKYRGEFEDRLKKVIEEAKDPSVILFIDEIHTLIGAGTAEGAMDGANILKPPLARGEIRLIGATTHGEYKKYIERDPALERRFAKVSLEEPSRDESILILKGLKNRYEKHHGITIGDDAIIKAVDLSIRYNPERFLPDKAIDLLDESAAFLHVSRQGGNPLKMNLEMGKKEALQGGNGRIAMRIDAVQKAYEKEEDQQPPVLTAEIVEQVLGKQLNLSFENDRKSRGQDLEKRLSQKIFGQARAISSLCRAVDRAKAGMSGEDCPLGVFLFVGPSGVGKSAAAKQLACELFGDSSSCVCVDMSEYAEQHSVSRLIGAPPGYVGYNEGGQLTEKVRRRPNCVLLLDEIGKAHREVYALLLQIFERGQINDSAGRTVSFRNCMIIMTENAGEQNFSKRTVGYVSKDTASDNRPGEECLKDIFPVEFLNRIDEIIFFDPLTKDTLKKIAGEKCAELQKKLKTKGVQIVFDESYLEHLTSAALAQPKYGARTIMRLIKNEAESFLSHRLLECHGSVEPFKFFWDNEEKCVKTGQLTALSLMDL